MASPSAPPATSGAERILQRCDLLATCSDEKHRLTRLFLSPALDHAHELVTEWMRAAHMRVHVDEMGNLVGRIGPQGAPALLMGSHLDTVPGGGRYDGALGIVSAIEAVDQLVASSSIAPQEWPIALEVVGFSDEEGVRFRTPYLGSHALAGTFDPGMLRLRDTDNVSLETAMRRFGLVPEEWPLARREARNVAGYFEIHIEQGPVLQQRGKALAVVSAIVGQSRLQVRFEGQAGHAGTLPMGLRRDALCAAALWIGEVEALTRRVPGLVATVGGMEVVPNVPNVVPGVVTCSLDVRHAVDDVRIQGVATLLEMAQQIANPRKISVHSIPKTEQPAVVMDSNLVAALHAAGDARGLVLDEMVSGAGHDAVVMAKIAPVAMLFVRTPCGRSHCPEEDVLAEDVQQAVDVTVRFLQSQLALL